MVYSGPNAHEDMLPRYRRSRPRQSVKSGCQFGDNKFLDCFIIDRQLLLEIIDQYASADYMDFFEAIAGDCSR